jgi:hypothetical protein
MPLLVTKKVVTDFLPPISRDSGTRCWSAMVAAVTEPAHSIASQITRFT